MSTFSHHVTCAWLHIKMQQQAGCHCTACDRSTFLLAYSMDESGRERAPE